jgi:SOS-response transcriptional repressor LexA
MPHTREAREDSKLGLAAEMLRSHGVVRIKAWGTSMLPSVWPGDLLTLRCTAREEVVPGDIVLALRENRFSIHRLIEKQEVSGLLITKGDAVPQNDPPVAASELLGRVVGIRRGHRSFVPSRRISPLHSALARVLCRWDRARSLALRLHAMRMQACATHP